MNTTHRTARFAAVLLRARFLGDRGTARLRRGDVGAAHAEGAHPADALVPLASDRHAAPRHYGSKVP